jgi:UDP-N-acetylglucosamine 1-carboxyvinyltransferase
MQPQLAALMCTAEGISTVSEGIWDHRFKYADELRKMGAQFMVEGKSATIVGTKRLNGAIVRSVDLRAGAALVIAGLAAEGQTTLEGLETLDRGYYDIVGKLRSVGADISRLQIIEANIVQLAK